MLSMQRVSSGQAGSYYTADDYYLTEDKGQWYGSLCQAMGFGGGIKESDFASLIQGVDPQGRFVVQSKITKEKEEHTAGVDFTFSAPKSVSVAALVLGDDKIQQHHDAAVKKALDYYEQNYAGVRVHSGKMVSYEQTKNSLVAMFKHVSSRELDPQVHTHCVVMNMSLNENGDVRAMDFGKGFDNKMLLGQIYRSELAKSLSQAGYIIESDSKGLFELKGMPQELTEEFSQRSQQIEVRFNELLEEHPNRNHAELRQQACLETRKVKDEPELSVLLQQWEDRAQAMINISQLKQDLAESQFKIENATEKFTIESIISKAIKIETETEAAPKLENLLLSAMKLSVGQHTVKELQEALDNNPEIVKLSDKNYTTLGIIESERQIVEQVIAGRDKFADSIDSQLIQKEIKTYELNKTIEAGSDRTLTAGQKDAILHILSSKDNIIAIQGDAGTGKTTMLDVVRVIAEKENKEIIGLSFTGKAASEIQDASQIKSNTIDSALARDESFKNKLVIIDEASLISIQKMTQILERCDETSKVVLIGDIKQLQAIGQGKIFQSLQEKDVINTVRMPEVIRQRDNLAYKKIVDNLGERNVIAAFYQLEQANKINEVVDRDLRLNSICDEYVKDAKNTIIVTASNKDREELNTIIRKELVNKGEVNSNSDTFIVRESKNLVGTEKFHIEKYHKDDVIVFNQSNHIANAGKEFKVVKVDHHTNQIKIADKHGHVRHLAINKHGHQIQAYNEKEKQFAIGDKIIFLKNDKGLQVKNGQTAYIESIDKNKQLKVKLENGKSISFNPNSQYKYLGHAYAVTDYKSQGQTAKNVIYHADTDKKVNFNQAYVGITRGKQNVSIYTNDKQLLKEQVQTPQAKTSTLDFDLTSAKAVNQNKLDQITRKVADTMNYDNKISNVRKEERNVSHISEKENNRER